VADSFIANLNLRKPEVGQAKDTWGGVAGLNGDLDILDGLFTPDGTGTSVGLKVGAGKTLDASEGTVLVSADRFSMADCQNRPGHAPRWVGLGRAGAAGWPSAVVVAGQDPAAVGCQLALRLDLRHWLRSFAR